ncbi:hypothetical protein ACWDWR_37510, partial [Nocardia sp. NPDC003354]
IQTLTTTVYAMNISPQTSLLFKAVVVIAVCLVQAPAVRARLRRRRRGTEPGPAAPQREKEQVPA